MRPQVTSLLTALDALLAPHGFRRRKRDQEWVRRPDQTIRDLIHFSIGVSLVTTSVSVHYLELESIVPKPLGAFYFRATLQSLAPDPPDFDLETLPEEFAKVLDSCALPWLFRLHDRQFAIGLLSSKEPESWYATTYSERIRLLPLLLASQGRIAEALRTVETIVGEVGRRDQRRPDYHAFAEAFRSRYAA